MDKWCLYPLLRRKALARNLFNTVTMGLLVLIVIGVVLGLGHSTRNRWMDRERNGSTFL